MTEQPISSRTRSRENVPAASSSTDPTPDEAASDPPTPPKVSEVPKVLAEEQIEYENYKKYVKGIVEKWLTGREEVNRVNNPKFKLNGLTNFLRMFAISSFLEVAKDAAKGIYEKLYGDKPGWFEDELYRRMSSLSMRQFWQHGKLMIVWTFLKSVGVKNFEPEELGDIEGWKNWLSAKQLFQLMEWCFANLWRPSSGMKQTAKKDAALGPS